MTELYDMKVYGEDITFGEKMVDSVRKYEKISGRKTNLLIGRCLGRRVSWA